jgi:amino acid adenylation domain-containing protein
MQDEGQAVSQLPLLGDEERHQVLYGWNATRREFSDGKCLHELIEEQVQRTPDAVAVVYENSRLTYAELNHRSNQLARYLRELGVGPDERVGVCMERSLEMMVGLVGVLKAGGAYVPLDPGYPLERLMVLLEDVTPRAVLIQERLRGLLPPLSATVVAVDALPERVAELSATDLPVSELGLTCRHGAYVIFTSGSTGRPKGVLNEHRGIVNRLQWAQGQYPMNGSDRFLQKTPFNFDVSVVDFFSPLLSGARLIMARPGGHLDPEYLCEVIESVGITRLHFVPSMLQAFMDHDPARRCASLRRVLCSGEELPAVLQNRFLTELPWSKLCNLYGPTEAAVDVSFWECLADDRSERVPIGRPIANTQMYVLDPRREPVPIGTPGELYLGGVGIARGYWGRPELTAERFVNDPYGTEANARMYRTGDLARWRPDGAIEYLGRDDFQVKIRGLRIELGEIEAQIIQHPGVRTAAVIAREDEAGEKRLVAYYTVKEAQDEAVDAGELRRHLIAKLPAYMVPAAYVQLQSLPLTTSGKLDRKALPAPQAVSSGRREYEEPQGELERALAAVWGPLLKVARVGRWDHFFELGGHSLLAVRMLARVQQTLRLRPSMADVFARPVLADLAASLAGAQRQMLPLIERVDRGLTIPLSVAQQGLWFLTQFQRGSTAYHIPLRLRLHGPLDAALLRRALDSIIKRHEVLRTRFTLSEWMPVQQITPAQDACFQLESRDLRSCDNIGDELACLVRDAVRAPFDLSTGPLIRGLLVRESYDTHTLLITMHHIVCDEWSLGVLLRELGAFYTSYWHGTDDPLPEPAVQYADYSVWQQRMLAADYLKCQGEYWKQTLEGAPALLELPLDRARPPQQDYASGYVPVVIDRDLTTQLRALSRRYDSTLFMTVLAGWAALLSRLSGQCDIVIGTPVANRSGPQFEEIVGYFVNMVALRVRIGDHPTVRQLLKHVREVSLAAQQHQDVPFEQVVKLVQPTRTLSHNPVFQATFAWQSEVVVPQLPGLRPEVLETDTYRASKFDLTLSLGESGGRLVGGIDYAASVFDAKTIEGYREQLHTILVEVAAEEHGVFAAVNAREVARRVG